MKGTLLPDNLSNNIQTYEGEILSNEECEIKYANNTYAIDMEKYRPMLIDLYKEILQYKQDEYDHQQEIQKIIKNYEEFEANFNFNVEQRTRYIDDIKNRIENTDNVEEKMTLIRQLMEIISNPIA